jgi:hypothetical protein
MVRYEWSWFLVHVEATEGKTANAQYRMSEAE